MLTEYASVHRTALSLICCQHYQCEQRVRERERQYSPLFLLCPLFMSHYSTRLTAYPIECPITAPKSFPFRFHCKTNVMSVVSQLISLSHLDCTQGMGLSLRVSSNAFNEKGVDCVDACLDVITSAWVRRQSLQSTPSASGIWYILGICQNKYQVFWKIDTNALGLTYSPRSISSFYTKVTARKVLRHVRLV